MTARASESRISAASACAPLQRASPTTFRPDAVYELALASDGGTTEDIALCIAFTHPGGP
jgi:hypothetical protein